MDKPRVLVVEDRPSVLSLMATILKAGYDVTTAADGATALSLIGSVPLDVVLTDIRMHGASGFDILREVQRRAPLTSVVMMTAYANVPDAVAAMRLGAFDYVAKPLEADEVSLVVARAVEHRHEALQRRPMAALPAAARSGQDGSRWGVSVAFHRAVEEARERASAEYLENLMRHFHGNVTQAAARAGMTRESLHRVLKRYGIQAEQYREPAREDGAQPDAGCASGSESSG
jgi:DNA-binding NtrC family response regulator